MQLELVDFKLGGSEYIVIQYINILVVMKPLFEHDYYHFCGGMIWFSRSYLSLGMSIAAGQGKCFLYSIALLSGIYDKDKNGNACLLFILALKWIYRLLM